MPIPALLLCSSLPASAQPLDPSDLVHQGVIAPPQIGGDVPKFAYGMLGLEYDPTCAGQTDPSPLDGYPGCLVGTTRPADDMIAMFDIPAPQVVGSGDYGSVPKGSLVTDFFKCSIRADGSDAQNGRDIPGVARSEAGDWICTCGHNWYSVSGDDYDSHCWFDFDSSAPNAQGAYGWGAAGDEEFHSQRMAWYMGSIPQAWANTHLSAAGQAYCFSGMERGGGGCVGCSGGPTIYAFPCARPSQAAPGPLMSAQQLLGYPKVAPLQVNTKVHPDYSPKSKAKGATWVGDTVLVAARKGGDYWWYGNDDPWVDVNAHRNECQFNVGSPESCFLDSGPFLPPGTKDICDTSHGYHAVLDPDGSVGPQYSTTLQFYDADELAEVASGTRTPESVIPYHTLGVHSEMWGTNCSEPGDLAYDPIGEMLYVVELNDDKPLIHVYSVIAEDVPELELTPGTLSFPTVVEGTSTDLELVFANTNRGSEPVVLASVVSSDPARFSVDASGGSAPCGSTSATIPAESSCTMTVSFHPATAGSFTGDMTMTSNTPTASVSLAGTSVAPCTAPTTLTVANEQIVGPDLRKACESISVGPTVAVVSGTLDLRAGLIVTLGDGFSVALGAHLSVEIDPLMQLP